MNPEPRPRGTGAPPPGPAPHTVLGEYYEDERDRRRFLDEVDPERRLPDADRERLAAAARKAFYQRLSLAGQRGRAKLAEQQARLSIVEGRQGGNLDGWMTVNDRAFDTETAYPRQRSTLTRRARSRDSPIGLGSARRRAPVSAGLAGCAKRGGAQRVVDAHGNNGLRQVNKIGLRLITVSSSCNTPATILSS